MSEPSVEARAESLSAPVDSTSAMTAPVVEAGATPFVSALATPTTPQDETFIVRRKAARKTVPVFVGALVVGAAAAFFAVDGPSVFRKGPQPTAASVVVTAQPAAKAPPVVPVPVPEPPPAAAPTPAPAQPAAAASAPANPDLPEGKGSLKTDTASSGRRIFVDGRVVGQTPATVVVPCGVRNIKIGSSGRTSAIDIPCQGEISIGD